MPERNFFFMGGLPLVSLIFFRIFFESFRNFALEFFCLEIFWTLFQIVFFLIFLFDVGNLYGNIFLNFFENNFSIFLCFFFKSDIEGWCPQHGREEEGMVLEYSNSWICMNVSPLKGLTTLLCLCSCQILHCNILNILPISQKECCCYGCLLQKVLMTVISANHLAAWRLV